MSRLVRNLVVGAVALVGASLLAVGVTNQKNDKLIVVDNEECKDEIEEEA